MPAPDFQALVQDIVAVAHPRQVILFGSHARDDAGPESDIDLLVIMPTVDDHHDLAVRIRESLPPNGHAIDILVRAEAEWMQRARIPGSVERAALREGIVLYAA